MTCNALYHCLALTVIVGIAEVANGHGAIPHDVPVDRLVANLTKYIEEHPEDPEGYYRLGRVHTLALETKSEFVLAYERTPPVPAEGSWAKRQWGREQHAEATPDQLKTHLTEAIKFLNQAIDRQPHRARYRLTLACALEAGQSIAGDVDVWPWIPLDDNLMSSHAFYIDQYRKQFESLPNEEVLARLMSAMLQGTVARDIIIKLAFEHRAEKDLQDAVQKIRLADWREQIEEQFFTAMCYALPQDGKAASKPIWGDLEDWVSFEAGTSFMRVVGARQSRSSDMIRLRVAKETVAAFKDLPEPGGITPIVIDLAGHGLAGIQSSCIVSFDLDGTGRPQCWSWVKPDVGILVWDPECSGRITSGRQLFGPVSWWLFFENGYEALDVLDDDRDGELTGAELKGLALWFDRNENGDSDPGEVEPIECSGIAALSCRAMGREGACLMNQAGSRMTDGYALTTYDWIATSR
jgi:hypothetical protein